MIKLLKIIFWFPVLLYMMALIKITKWIGKKASQETEQNTYSWKIFLFFLLTREVFQVKDELSFAINQLAGEQMITVRTEDSVVDFIPKSERGSEKPTTLKFKRLSRAKLAEIRDRMVALNRKGRVEGIRNESVVVNTVTAMLVGWDNVADESGRIVKFDIKDQKGMYDMLPSEIQEEVEKIFGEGSVNWEAREAKLAKEEEATADEAIAEAEADAAEEG